MKLFKYELKKNVLRLSVFILLLALIGVNLFKQHETARFLGDSRIAIGVEDKSSLGRKMYEEYKSLPCKNLKLSANTVIICRII